MNCGVPPVDFVIVTEPLLFPQVAPVTDVVSVNKDVLDKS